MSNNKKTEANQVTPQTERKDPTGFLLMWLGSLAIFIVSYAIFVHKLQ